VALAALTSVLAACSRTTPTAACGPITLDQLAADEGHLIARSSTAPHYAQNPPTSGPHIAGLTVTGVPGRTLTGVEQVSTLESGVVLVQYRSTGRADRHRLESIAGDTVTVAPNGGLPAPVVATGWQRTMRCDRVDLSSLRKFVREMQGRYDGHAIAGSNTAGG